MNKLSSAQLLPGLAALVLAMAGIPSAAEAQSGTLNRYRASETPEDDFHLSRPTDFGDLRFGAQLQLDYALNPLVWETVPGDASSETIAFVEHMLTGNLGLSFGLADRVVIYAGLPFIPVNQGADAAAVSATGGAPTDGPGLGDVYLGARVRLFGEDEDAGALALQVTGTFPTSGDGRAYRGDPFLTVHPELLGEVRPGAGSRIVMNVGVRVREETQWAASNLEFRHELTYAAGFAMPLWTDEMAPGTHLDVHAQIYGDTSLNGFGDYTGTALEATVGMKFFHESGIVAGLAGGPGLTRGFGSPDLRLIASFAWAMPEETEAAPAEAPVQATDADTDGDGLLDGEDRCPTVPGPASNAGCPESDRDSDTVIDRLDNCPDEPGPPENQGCVAQQRVVIRDGGLQILDRVFFHTDSAQLRRESDILLLNVALVLNRHPEITHIRVEGHTDSRGGRDHNLQLSQARAQTVLEFLVSQGHVDRSRLSAAGFGPDRPIVPNARTPEQHAQNRRVEFNIPQTAGVAVGHNAADANAVDR